MTEETTQQAMEAERARDDWTEEAEGEFHTLMGQPYMPSEPSADVVHAFFKLARIRAVTAKTEAFKDMATHVGFDDVKFTNVEVFPLSLDPSIMEEWRELCGESYDTMLGFLVFDAMRENTC